MNSPFRSIAFVLYVLFLSASSVSADFKCEFGNKQTTITLQGKKDSITLQLRSPGAFSAEVFSLENPARIVMDFEGLKLKSHKSPSVPKNKILKGVRMAISPSKIRIVLDLKIDEIPEYSTSQEGNTFTFSAGMKSEILALMPKETPTSAAVTPEPAMTPSAVPAAPSPSVVTAEVAPIQTEAAPVETPSPVFEPSETPSPIPSDVRALKSIEFQITPEPILRLSLTKESSFRLSKEKESYLLTVPECAVAGNHLLLPNYPPEGFPGINVVKGATEKGDLLLWIYVARTARLSAYRNGTEIWVKVTEVK